MFKIIILTAVGLLFTLVIITFIMGLARKQSPVGRPSIALPFFLLAKIFPFCNLVFLLLYGLNAPITILFNPPVLLQYIGIFFLITGTTIVIMASSILKADLIFGLPKNEIHQLQTTGLYAFSRHPFYMGFLMILFPSIIFVPNIFNILAFAGAWILHHFIMINEEQYLLSKYGETYKIYLKKVGRYFTF